MGYHDWVTPTAEAVYALKELLEDVASLRIQDGTMANTEARKLAANILEEVTRGTSHFAAVAAEGYRKLEERNKRLHQSQERRRERP